MKHSTTILLATARRAAPLVAAVLLAGLPAGCGGGDSTGGTPTIAARDTHVVEKSSFDMILPVSGELAARNQVELRNKLETRAVITEIVPEGTRVSKGDILVRLAQEEILDKTKDAKDKVNTTQSAAIAAQQSYSIKQGERQSELDKADVAVRIAELALEGWQQGEVVNKRQELQLAKETAVINYDRLKGRFEESAKLVEQRYIAKDEFEKDRIAMIEAEAKVKQAGLNLEVYEKYTYFQDEAKKKSDLEQARAERSRVEEKFNAELVKAQADLESANFQLQSAKERLANLETQISYTTLAAPIDGLVVYATSIDSSNGGRGGGDAQPPQVGTELRPNELVILLPDTSNMVANLKVSEALSGRIAAGQRVTVYSDALPNQAVGGSVTGVSVLAASGGWRDPNRREYTVKTALEADPSLGLKPAMRCKAEILLGRVDDALNIPVQAVFRQGPVTYVYVNDGAGFSQRQITLGRASELQVEVTKGVEAGEKVLLREPKAAEIVKKLDPSVFELANASMPSFGGAGGRGGMPAMNATPDAGGGAGGPPAGAREGRGSGRGRPDGAPRGERPAGGPPQGATSTAAPSGAPAGGAASSAPAQ
ncbi:MAG: HlyD family efflux transporter periplasmic adaptor subunit [Planctomycetaceae bacterium]|nr:HlyD family efflux transporter periplasmic adaptor subunit [Planctomycetaceae bacterium]